MSIMEFIRFGLWNLALIILMIIQANGQIVKKISTPMNVSNESITEETNASLPCGSSFCQIAFDEICSPKSICECPSQKDRRNESSKCSDFKEFTFPLIIAKQQKVGSLSYNSSYSDANSPVYIDMKSIFEIGMTNILKQTTFFQDFIRLGVNKIFQPTAMNKTLSDAGLWIEFTIRFVENQNLNEINVYDDLIRVISNNDYTLGGVSVVINRYQQPMQCFNNDCNRDGLCLADGDRFVCRCQLGCNDLDPTKPGRICSCPCDNHDCDQYSDCIPSNDGYVCKCKSGFITRPTPATAQDQIKRNSNPMQCVIDYCQFQQNICEKRNATCLNYENGWECKCLDGFVDVRKSTVKKSGGFGDAICLKPADVDECSLKTHDCFAPAKCVKSMPRYRCVCPDGSELRAGEACSPKSLIACDQCNRHGTCYASPDNFTTICKCEDGYFGDTCSIKMNEAKEALIWRVGNLEIEWSWTAFGIGAGLGVFVCLLIFVMVVVIKRSCRKKPAIRPSVDDEIFNFREVARNVYGVGNIGADKSTTSLQTAMNGSSQNAPFRPVEGPYAVSEVGVSTFKRNGQL